MGTTTPDCCLLFEDCPWQGQSWEEHCAADQHCTSTTASCAADQANDDHQITCCICGEALTVSDPDREVG